MTEPQPAVTETPPPVERRKLWPWVAVGVVFLVIIVAAVAVPVTIAQREADEKAAAEAAEQARLAQFSEAMKRCSIRANNVVIHDSGESIEMSRVTLRNGMTFQNLTCFLASIDAPDSIEAKIGQTRSIDGRRTDSWDGFKIEWSYHPDDGASIIIEHDR